MRFRGKKHNDSPDPVILDKASNLEQRREAEQAVRESLVRASRVAQQRGVVARLVASLAEVREQNHFADGIRAAMGSGGQQ